MNDNFLPYTSVRPELVILFTQKTQFLFIPCAIYWLKTVLDQLYA